MNLLCSRFDDYNVRQNVLDDIDFKVGNIELNNKEDIFKYISDLKEDEIKDSMWEFAEKHEGIRSVL